MREKRQAAPLRGAGGPRRPSRRKPGPEAFDSRCDELLLLCIESVDDFVPGSELVVEERALAERGVNVVCARYSVGDLLCCAVEAPCEVKCRVAHACIAPVDHADDAPVAAKDV